MCVHHCVYVHIALRRLAVLQFLSIWYLGYGGEFTEQAASAAAAEGASAAAKVAASVAVKVAEVVTDGST